MANQFNPYHKWLGIPPREQPADHYRLLGVARFEDDADVISLAADQRMQFLRSFQNGERAKLSQQLLNEVAAARVCLLDSDKKIAYDKKIQQQITDEQGAASHSAETPTEDLAATLEFAAPDSVPEWPPGVGDENEADNLWNLKSDNSASPKKQASASSTLTSKTKTRLLITSLLSSLALLLLLGLGIAGLRGTPEKVAKIDSDKNSAAPKASSPEEGAEPKLEEQKKQPVDREAVQLTTQEAEQRAEDKAAKDKAAKDKAAKARRPKTRRDRKAKEAQQRAREEARQKAQEDADRRKREKSNRERIQREREAFQQLQQRVDQSIEKAERLKYRPNQALQVIRESIADVDKAPVPFRLKRSQKQKLQSVALKIERLAAEQRAKQKVEEEETWRREHPDEYLESLGVVKEKNTWVIEAAVEVNELNKPLAKLIAEYKRKAKEIEKKETRIKQQETRLENGMKKLPGAFQSAEFRKWIMDGMQEYPNAPPGIRILVDKGREQFDRFRDRNPRIANELEQKLGQLQTMKMQYQSDIEVLESTVDDISKMDRTTRDLLRKITKTEQRLDQKNINVQSAVQSSGIAYTPPETTNIENLLEKSDEILEDDLVDSLRDRPGARF